MPLEHFAETVAERVVVVVAVVVDSVQTSAAVGEQELAAAQTALTFDSVQKAQQKPVVAAEE